MKIQNNPLQALHDGDEARKKAKATEGFDSLLAGQLQAGSTEAGSASSLKEADHSAASLALLMQASNSLNGVESAEGVEGDSVEAVLRISGLLDQWENYANALAKPGGTDLRSAYGMLQNMATDLQGMKAQFPTLAGTGTGLSSLFNELEVLTTTETIKFNRGDYL